MTQMLVEVQEAEKGLSAFGRFLQWIKKNDRLGYEDRVAAVSSVLAAAIKTRQYLRDKAAITQNEMWERENEISSLWLAASQQVGRFDKKLGEECLVKAYGWGTGVWDHPSFEIVPRRVEEVLANALRLNREYAPILTEEVLH
jgi:hypothetical protein